jgi:hypothetical protein
MQRTKPVKDEINILCLINTSFCKSHCNTRVTNVRSVGIRIIPSGCCVKLRLHSAPTERNTRWLHVVLTLSVGGSASNSLYRLLSSFSRSRYLQELLKICIMYFFDIGCCDWTVRTQGRASDTVTNELNTNAAFSSLCVTHLIAHLATHEL